jgi:hypothetical protein
VKVWLSRTNQFANGQPDEYELMAEVPVEEEGYRLDISDQPSDFYKIVLEGPHNTLNRWVKRE